MTVLVYVTLGLAKKGVVRKRFRKCLGRAEALFDGQTGTNPTFTDVIELMRLRSGLEDKYLCMEEKLDFFLQYDMVYVNEASFYEELSDIGKATERAVGEALSEPGEFLGSLTDVDGIFRNSRAACL